MYYDIIPTDINIEKHHLTRVRKNSPNNETRNMTESHNQMTENIADNLKLLLMHDGLQLSELLLILRTRIKPSITLSISNVRQSLHQICPNWWDAEIVGNIIQITSEIVGAKVNENPVVFGNAESDSNGRIDRSNRSLTDGERTLGISYAAIIQEMKKHYDEHQDWVDRFFYEHTVVYAKFSDGDHVACICYDPRQLDIAANSAVRMRARKALVHFSSIEYTIVLLNLDEIAELSLSYGTASTSDTRERLYAQLKGEKKKQSVYQASENAQGSNSHINIFGETSSVQQESQHEFMTSYDTTLTCKKCSQLGKAIAGEDETHQNSPTDTTPLPFLNEFPCL